MYKKLFSTTTLVSLMAMPTLAFAQDAPGSADDYRIGEVVVTARKVSERLQTTPVAVTALTAQSLETQQIVNVQDLQKAAPSLSTSTGGPGGPGVIYLAIRGQVNNSGGSGTDSAVGTYVDGVYWARPTSGNFGVLDAAQAEILRGPQGTLFGRNTTGGALNITTTQPTGEFGGYAKADYGNYNAMTIEGAATLPLQGEQLSARVAARYAKRDGYYDNPLTGAEVSDLDNSIEGRITVKWAPESLPLTLTVAADATHWKDNGQATAVRGINKDLKPFIAFSSPAVVQALTGIPIGHPAQNPILAFGNTDIGGFFLARGLNPDDYILGLGGEYDEAYGVPNSGYPPIDTPVDKGDLGGIAATLDVDFGAWDLKSISAWRKADATNSLVMDGTPLALVQFQGNYRQEQWSQELQATTQIGKLSLLGGLYYFKEKGREDVPNASFFRFPIVGGSIAANLGKFESTSKGVFAQANYSFTDQLRGTIGYRYTWDERDVVREGVNNIFVPTSCTAPIPLTPSGCSLPISSKFSYPAWTIGLDYELTDGAFIYVKASRASMAGGINLRPTPAGQESFAPEESTDIELGGKFDFVDGRLRANVAIFTAETKGAQRIINGLINNRTSQWTANSGDVDTKGVELELTALPWRGMELKAGATYLDASYQKGSFIENRGTPALPLLVDRSDEPVPQAPEWAFNISATQDFELSIGTLTAHLDYSYFDDKVIIASTPTPGSPPGVLADVAELNRLGSIDNYSLLNGRLSLALRNGFEVSIWGRNLMDKEYLTYIFESYLGAGFVTGFQGAPRTYGVGVKYAF